MSTDPIGAAVTLDHPTVIAAPPQIASDQSSELTGIAAAIERVEALLATTRPEPEGSDAVERIADIAFVLHERDVERSLCDALDAAVRELSNADAAKQANVQHVRQAAELLRELSVRVSDMIALLQVSRTTGLTNGIAHNATPEQGEAAAAEQPVSVDAPDGDIPSEGLFTAETLENDEFARAVADLAASLPTLTEPVEAIVVAPHESADPATNELTLAAESEEAAIGAQDEAIDLAASADELATEQPAFLSELDEVAAGRSAEPQTDRAELSPDRPALEQPPPAIDGAPISEQAPAQEWSIDEAIEQPVTRENESFAAHPPAEASRRDTVSDAEPQSRVLESSPALLPELALVDPQDDPGDLFEPLTGAAPPIAAATLADSQAASENPPRAAAMRAQSPAMQADPLAPLHAFGAEELVALFT